MQLGVQSLVVGLDVQDTGAADVHGHFGVESAVVLVELLGVFHITVHHGFGLVDLRHMGAGDAVPGAVGQEHIGAGGGGIHLGGGILPVAALVDIVEDHGGCQPAGDFRVVQDQGHHGGGIILGVLAQVNGDLTGGELARDPVDAGLGDVDDSVGGGLLTGVGLVAFALAVGLVVTGLIIDDVVRGMDAGVGGELDALVGQKDVYLAVGFRGLGGGYSRGGAAGEQRHGQKDAQKLFQGNPLLSRLWK